VLRCFSHSFSASGQHAAQEPMTPRIDHLLAAQEEDALEAQSPNSRVDVLVRSLQSPELLEGCWILLSGACALRRQSARGRKPDDRE